MSTSANTTEKPTEPVPENFETTEAYDVALAAFDEAERLWKEADRARKRKLVEEMEARRVAEQEAEAARIAQEEAEKKAEEDRLEAERLAREEAAAALEQQSRAPVDSMSVSPWVIQHYGLTAVDTASEGGDEPMEVEPAVGSSAAIAKVVRDTWVDLSREPSTSRGSKRSHSE